MIMNSVGGLQENSSVNANILTIFFILDSCSLLILYSRTAPVHKYILVTKRLVHNYILITLICT